MSAVLQDLREKPVSPPALVLFGATRSFAEWRQAVRRRGALPVIAVAGSRGKSSVIRLLEAVFARAGIRSAIWTNAGVEVRGRKQGSELAAWGRAMRRLVAGTLDVAIQELDWPTVHAVGLPTAAYPIAVVTNICANNERCLVRDEARMAIRAYDRVRSAARRDGVLVLNGDDYAVAGTEVERTADAVLVGLNPDAPLLQAHLSDGGEAAWVRDQWMTLGNATASTPLCSVEGLEYALGGAASFELYNGLFAASVAGICGIDRETIAAALGEFRQPHQLAGSFTLIDLHGATAIVDRPAPSWFLRSILRAVRHRPHRKLIVVAGTLDGVPDDDLEELGRLLSRAGDAVLVHARDQSAFRRAALRRGLGASSTPILTLSLHSERQAITKAAKMLRPGDMLLVLADAPAAAVRTVERLADRAPVWDAGPDRSDEVED